MGVEPKTYKSKEGKEFTIVTIKDENNNKFKFYTKKVNGEETKAWQQFKEQQMGVGKQAGVAFSEEDKEFTNNEGKNIKFKERKVMFFANADQMEGFNVVDSSDDVKEETADDIPF